MRPEHQGRAAHLLGLPKAARGQFLTPYSPAFEATGIAPPVALPARKSVRFRLRSKESHLISPCSQSTSLVFIQLIQFFCFLPRPVLGSSQVEPPSLAIRRFENPIETWAFLITIRRQSHSMFSGTTWRSHSSVLYLSVVQSGHMRAAPCTWQTTGRVPCSCVGSTLAH
jgi:hypothetical protein